MNESSDDTPRDAHRGVIALDQVVSPLPVDVSDTVEMRVIPMIDVANDAPIGRRFVRADCDWPMQPDPLDGLVEESPGRPRVPSGGQSKIDHLTVRIDRPPEVAPFAFHADVSFVHVPIDACAAQVSLGSFR